MPLAAWAVGDPSAPPVVLVHGYPDTAAVWDVVADALAARYRVITYDVRGAGASGAPGGRAGYRIDALAADARLVAAAASPGRRVHLVGHDWGSVTGWAAVTGPGAEDWIASYTSVSGPCLDHTARWIRERVRRSGATGARQLLRQQARSWYVAAFQLPVVPELMWRHVIGPRWGDRLRRVEHVAPHPGHPAPTLVADAINGLELYRANVLGALRGRPRDAGAGAPVQVVVPLRDAYITPSLARSAVGHASPLWVRELDTGHWGAVRTHGARLAGWIGELAESVDRGVAAPALADARVS